MDANLLRNVYLFKDLTMAELVEVLQICRRERFEKDRFIFLEGELGEKCYIIETGEVRISKYVNGIGDELLKVLRPGEYFGEMALIDHSPRSATAAANGETSCLVISKTDLDALLTANKELGNKILLVFCQTLSHRLRETNEKISNFIANTAGFGGPLI